MAKLGTGMKIDDHRRQLWRQAAASAALVRVEEGRADLAGRSGPFSVRLATFGEERSGGTAISIRGGGIPENLTVRPEGMSSTIFSARGVREIEVGDAAFDREAWVEGSPAPTRALLDAGMRRILRALFRGQLEIESHPRLWARGRIERGVLRIEVALRAQAAPSGADSEGPPWAGEIYLDGEQKLSLVLPAALALAERLRSPRDVAARLAQKLPDEPVAGVRVHLLTTLLREFPEHPATRPAVARALGDPDAEVRLRAGIALGGEEGRDVLLSLARGEGAEDSVNARAVGALRGRIGLTEVVEVLQHALRTRRIATGAACLQRLAAIGGPDAIAHLARVLAVEKGELALAACEALGSVGAPSAEPPLLQALAGPVVAIRVASARALGSVGTSAAVLSLKDAEKRGGELRRAAREAVARIQIRLAEAGGASPGQVSLSSATSGDLSLVDDDERGRLTLSAAPARRRRPPGG